MGMFDSIIIHCPNCGAEHEAQSKSGHCLLNYYTLDNCPDDVMFDANRHSPFRCDCGVKLHIDTYERKVIIEAQN